MSEITLSCESTWDDALNPNFPSSLVAFIAIPNQSPDFDPSFATNGLQEEALDCLMQFSVSQKIPGLIQERIQRRDLTPILLQELPPTPGYESKGTVLLYAHGDKQPPLADAWSEGLMPYKPTFRGAKLYGRGSVDDGWGTYGSIAALKAVTDAGLPHARIILITEFAEESGGDHVEQYLKEMPERFGDVSLIFCLDSGAGDYEHFWVTNSLRGGAAGVLKVSLLRAAVHSGSSSGIVPDSFRVVRALLERLEDSASGRVIPEGFHVTLPAGTEEAAAAAAAIVGPHLVGQFAWQQGVQAAATNATELILANTWRPALTVTGAEGFPPPVSAGNVNRTHSTLKLSLRLPPTADPDACLALLRSTLLENPPYNAHVTFESADAWAGWAAPPMNSWLKVALDRASSKVFAREPMFIGEGGSIPFMGVLQHLYPKAQFIVTGCGGPNNGSHTGDEFLDTAFARRVSTCLAYILADHAQSS